MAFSRGAFWRGAFLEVVVRRETMGIVVAGHRLAAERLLPRAAGVDVDRPTLVFLHEGLGCIGMWKDVPERLCAGTNLPGLVFDRQGHGGSAPLGAQRPPRYLHDEALIVLPRVLAAAGIERPILVGHSDGGTIALLAAALLPAMVRAVVAIAAHIHVEAAALAGIRETVRMWQEDGLRARLRHWHGPKTDALFHAWADTWLSPAFRHWTIAEEVRSVACPTLLLQGSADQYATPGHLHEIAAAVGETATAHLLPGLGHSPHLADREGFAVLVADFIDRTAAGR